MSASDDSDDLAALSAWMTERDEEICELRELGFRHGPRAKALADAAEECVRLAYNYTSEVQAGTARECVEAIRRLLDAEVALSKKTADDEPPATTACVRCGGSGESPPGGREREKWNPRKWPDPPVCAGCNGSGRQVETYEWVCPCNRADCRCARPVGEGASKESP